MSLQNQIVDTLINGAGSGLVDGELVRVSANKTIARASASAAATVAGFIGAVSTSSVIGVGGIANVVVGGVARVRMETGLTLFAGQTLYVSGSVAGAGTNIPPGANAVAFGVIKDTTGYATGNPYVVAEIGSLAAIPGVDAADWDIGTTRYYAVDYDNGSDANVGYSDVSMAAAGLVAFKTLEQFFQSIPKIGRGRRFVCAVKTRANGADYLRKDGTTVDYLNVAELGTGYTFGMLRGTNTFANDTADKIQCGGITQTAGPNADGSWTAAGGATTNTFSVAAGALPAETSIVGYRVRFTGNVTPALANQTAMIWQATAGAGPIVTSRNLASTPQAGDTFFIERPGVAVDRIIGTTAIGSPSLTLTPHGLQIVGFRLRQNVAISPAFITMTTSIGMTFIEADTYIPPIANFTRAQYTATYKDEAGAFQRPGFGVRATKNDGGLGPFNTGLFAFFVECAIVSANNAFALIGLVNNAQIGQGCYFGVPVEIQQVGGGVNVNNSTNFNYFGNGTGSSTLRNARFVANTPALSGAVVAVNLGCSLRLRGIDISNAGAIPCIKVIGNCNVTVDGIVSALGGNTDVVLDLTGASGASVVCGKLAANTITATAGDTRIVGPSGNLIRTFAEVAANSYEDKNANLLSGAADLTVARVTNGTWANVPVLAADPATPLDGDVWIKNTGGVRTLNTRIAGVTYSTVLT